MEGSKILRTAEYMLKDFAASRPSSKPSERIWLISERGYDAQDNGFAFFKWICANHPEIHPVYIISSEDPDYEKVYAIGDTAACGSRRHYDLMYQAEALISTHAFGYTPDMVIYSHLARAGLFAPDGISVFLQHGVLDKKASWISRERFKPDLFEASTWMEADLIREFNHQPESVIMRSGQCRYDSLYCSKPKPQILIFPTWREWLKDVSRSQFIESDFYKEWQEVLESKGWEDLPEGWSVRFHLHPEFRKYSEEFHSQHVTIDADSDIGVLIRESSAVLTDYSSVYFDFLYRNLPVTFFQFDTVRFQKEHYGLTFPYEDCGKVFRSPSDAVSGTFQSLGDAGKRREMAGQIFFFQDDHNCERTFDAIEAKIQGKGVPGI